MKKNQSIVIFYIVFFAATFVASADQSIKMKTFGNGWSGMATQVDPFDQQKVKVIQISKGDFTFRCGQLNMKVGSYGFESLSFGADIKYITDTKEPIDKQGRYSTYLGGSDMVTDDRYYSFALTDEDLEAMKSAELLKVAGKYSSTGWETKSLKLIGFTSAYSEMCK